MEGINIMILKYVCFAACTWSLASGTSDATDKFYPDLKQDIELGIVLTPQYQKVNSLEDEPKTVTSRLLPSAGKANQQGYTWKQNLCIGGAVLGWGTVTALNVYNIYSAISNNTDQVLEAYNKNDTTIIPTCRRSQTCQTCDVSIYTDFVNRGKLDVGHKGGCNSYSSIKCPDFNVTQALESIVAMKNEGYIASFLMPRDSKTYYSLPAFGKYPSGSWTVMLCNRTAQGLEAAGFSGMSMAYYALAAIVPTFGFIGGCLSKGFEKKESVTEVIGSNLRLMGERVRGERNSVIKE